MLSTLYIKNYAIIDEITLAFPSSLTTITGETGSGKSILLGALGLIMGNRADIDKLYQKDQKCIVEAHFKVKKQQVEDFFKERDFDYDDTIILRREISSSGKSRAFINDTPALLKDLHTLSVSLIQQHQQFDTMEITDASYQLKLVDSLADHGKITDDYSKLFQRRRSIISEIQKLRDDYEKASREQDYIAFQLKEIEELGISQDEAISIDEEFRQLQHADEIIEMLSQMTSTLSGGDKAIADRLRELRADVLKLTDYLPEGAEILSRIEASMLELEDISQTAYSISESIDSDPLKLQTLHKAVDKLQHLLKKHQLSEYAQIFELRDSLRGSLKSIENADAEIHQKQIELEETEEKLIAISRILRANRKDLIPALEENVKKQLATLAMPHAQFVISLNELEEPGPNGMDSVDFLFNANKGGEVHSLKQVASGGEMSRVALVLNSLVAKSMTLPTLIFDEIDSGVSGDVALKMGKILKEYSREHQVIVITHSPQIAAQGDKHYFVSKRVDDKRTYAEIHPVENEERINKIAIMLSQNPPSEAAQRNAEELLNYKFN